jgi:hypothetical protein
MISGLRMTVFRDESLPDEDGRLGTRARGPCPVERCSQIGPADLEPTQDVREFVKAERRHVATRRREAGPITLAVATTAQFSFGYGNGKEERRLDAQRQREPLSQVPLHETDEGVDRRAAFTKVPLAIRDHHRKVVSRDYFIIHAFERDCLDLLQCGPTSGYMFDEGGIAFNGVARLVIDEKRVPPDVAMLRIKLASKTPLILRRDLADAIVARGFSGVVFRDLVDYVSSDFDE